LLASAWGPAAVKWFDSKMLLIFPPPSDVTADELEKRVQYLKSAIKVTTTKGSSVLKLAATTRDAQLSADIINTLQSLYIQDRLAEQNRTAVLIEKALKEREQNTREQISEAEDRLTDVLGKPGAIEQSEIPGLMRDMSQLGARYAEAQAELARRQSDYNAAVEQRAVTKGNPIAFADALGGGRLPLLRQQYDNVQQEAARLPLVDPRADIARASMQRQLNKLSAQISAEANRIVEQRRTSMLAAEQVVKRLDQEMTNAREKRGSQVGATIALERERGAVASLWRNSDAIEARLVDLAARPANPNSRILTAASVPTRPAFPSKVLFSLAGLVLGTVAAGGYALMAMRAQGLQLAAGQMAEQLNAPLLGGVPRLRGIMSGPRRLIGYGSRDDTLRGPVTGVVIELEKAIRSGKVHSLLVTSGRAGEGKTTIVTGLGRALSWLGLRVLVVDLDLRHPRAEAALKSSSATGLHGDKIPIGDLEPLIVKIDRASGVHVFTPQVDDVAETVTILRSEALDAVLRTARERYDILLIDSPPLLLVPDALIAARLADEVLLVTEFGRTNARELEEISRRLAQAGRPIHGVIATKVEWDDPTSGVYMGY
jgi:succinoglycan biosynthesis transport protein ExoP